MPMRDMDGPYGVAVQILQDAESGRPVNEQLEGWLRVYPSRREFVTIVVHGVRLHRARLDFHIDAHALRPKRIRGKIRQAFRVAAFELLELGGRVATVTADAVRILPHELQSTAEVLLVALDQERLVVDALYARGE